MDQAQSSSTTPLTAENLSRLSPDDWVEDLIFRVVNAENLSDPATESFHFERVEDLITRIEAWRSKVATDLLKSNQEETAYPYETYKWTCTIQMSSSDEDPVNGDVSDAGIDGNGPSQVDGAADADLFGSDSENEGQTSQVASSKRRKLDDAELDSGDDEGRPDRAEEDYDEPRTQIEREENILDVDIGRHAIPKPSDGELHLLQFPSFLGIEEKAFTPTHWNPPTTEHHTSDAPSSTFSAYTTSNNTIRWRHSPSEPSEIQSNARILRWSDGSLTIQLASNPREQFALSAKALAPPQVNPPKPTPTSISKPRAANGTTPYNARLDSHTYLASPHEAVSLVRLTNHITSSLVVQSHADQDDEALIKLQETMAAASKGKAKTADGGLEIVHVTEDPEKAKLEAERFEKERTKATRRRQVAEERDQARNNRVLGRSGLRQGGYGAGLTVGGLEDDDGMATTRARPSKPRAKKPRRRRNSEYSDEEDYPLRGRTREDEYDEDDGFLVGSDEELEVGGDGSEEEEDIDMEDEKEEKKPKKSSSRKEVAEPAERKEATEPVDTGTGGGRSKRRRVIDEDEDDE